MPFKDPEKERAYRKQQARKRRANEKLKALSTGQAEVLGPIRGHTNGESLQFKTLPAWTEEKLKQAWAWWSHSQTILKQAPLTAARLALMAMTVIDANLAQVAPPPESSSAATVKGKFLGDPEYLRLLRALAVREGELLDQAEAS